MATIDDIIKLSGVSRSTVNRFLAGQTVRGDNAKKIKSAMKELNYRPDKLVEKRNCIIEIIGASSQKRLSQFRGYAEMMVGMLKTLEKEGATVLVHSGSTKYIPRADGVIAYGLNADVEDEIVDTLKRRNIPLVFAYREIDRPGVSYVTSDNYQAAYEMTEMLIKNGHKRIAVCTTAPQKRNIPEKLQGFRDCMEANKLQIPSFLVYESSGKEGALAAWINKLLDNKDSFTAFFALTDAVAFKFMEEAQKRGFKIPEDFAVVGMDGTAEAFYSKPKLTSVAIPFEEIGRKSAEAIFELIDNPDTVCIRKYLKYEISYRESH